MGIFFTPKSLYLIFIFFLVCGQNFLYVSRKPSNFPIFSPLVYMCDRVDFQISKSSDPLIYFFVKKKHFCCCFAGWFLIFWQLGLNSKPVYPRKSTNNSTYPPVIYKGHAHNLLQVALQALYFIINLHESIIYFYSLFGYSFLFIFQMSLLVSIDS